MRNSRLLPYETIVQAANGEPEAVNAVLQHYKRYIRFSALVDGKVDKDTEDYITQTLLTETDPYEFGRERYCNELSILRSRNDTGQSVQSWGIMVAERIASPPSE